MRNSKGLLCQRCEVVHDYLTRLSSDAPCDTPLAFSLDRAVEMANQYARGDEDVVRVPDDSVVVMDDSARRLPRTGSGTLQLAQYTNVERSA